MFHSNFEKILKKLTEFEMNVGEKEQIRSRLLEFMAFKPVRIVERARHQSRSNISSMFLIFAKSPMTIILSIIILLTAGTSLAAEAALPGDALHTFKMAVNEEVRAALTLGAEAEADWEIRRAERRLEEAEQLAEEGRLSAQVSGRIEENFEAHAERVGVRIAAFEVKENFRATADLSSRFETSLRAHEDILARLSTTTPAETEGEIQINKLRSKVKARAEQQAEIRVKIQQRLDLGATATSTTPSVCIQVITPAINRQTGEQREFPTPCDVPEGWEAVTNPGVQGQGSIKGHQKLQLELGL